MATELLPTGMRVPLDETDAPAPKLMRQLKDLFPWELTEQLILERALPAVAARWDRERKLSSSESRGPFQNATSNKEGKKLERIPNRPNSKFGGKALSH